MTSMQFPQGPRAGIEKKALALAKKNATEVWPDERPWLEQEDLDALVKKADDAGAWLDDQEKAQKKLKNHEEPAFRVAELNAKLKPTVVLAARLNAKKKPVVIEGERDERDGRQRHRRQRDGRERDGRRRRARRTRRSRRR